MLFGSRKTEMVTPQEALPGRDTPMPVPERHEVLGTPLRGPWPAGHEVIHLAMGCFWGGEELFWQLPGVYSTAVGYQGGYTPNPTYEETCTARTGHAETVLVVYDPARVSLETLLKVFWENHDPTTPNRQGNDVGTQYRSVIFYHSPGQKAVAEQVISDLDAARLWNDPIVTEITPASTFYIAEDYHQGYFELNPHQPYCRAVVAPKVAKFRKQFLKKLKKRD